jgi:hypothetical protein
LGASICFAAGLLGEALRHDRAEHPEMAGTMAALILGVIGLALLFAGLLQKRE